MNESEIEVNDNADEDQSSFPVRGIVVFAVALAISFYMGIVTALLVLACVFLSIMIHEFGHFITAKWSGMKVTEFFIGFGPKLWSFRRGETEYGIKIIPAGGYVKIIGMNNLEEVDPADEHRTYRRQPYWQRLMVTSAGSFMHFVIAFFILLALSGWLGLPTLSKSIGTVSELKSGPSPAQIAGFQKDDEILAVDGKKAKKWTDVTTYVQGKVGQPVDVTIKRNGQTLHLNVTPVDRRTVVLDDGTTLAPASGPASGFIGVGAAIKNERVGLGTALTDSASSLWHTSGEVITLLRERFSPSGIQAWAHDVANPRSLDKPANRTASAPSNSEEVPRLHSPIGLVSFANDAANAGIRAVLGFLFSVNLFLGIFNLVPLLPFDGGHIAIATYERIRSRRNRPYMADFNKMIPVSYVVLILLVVMFLSAAWLDILSPPKNPFQ